MRRQSPSSLPATVPLLVACLTGTLHARAESIISSGEGRRVIGDVKSEDESNVEVEIYRGFTHKVPKAAIATRQDIDRRLVVGGLMFGAGWGLAGFCPGPALVSMAAGHGQAVLFVGAMLAGMGLYELFDRRMARPATA